jgi:general secretion pathway protein E
MTPAIQTDIASLNDGDDWAVQTVDLLLRSAEERGCSDLHVVCRRDGVLARGRRDGALFVLAELPVERRDMLIARLKVLAGRPAFIRHEPQDGRIEWRSGDKNAPPRILRASFLPTIHGEHVVVRFPERDAGLLRLEALGMPPDVLAGVDRLLGRQEGTILLTGPSSSGKTTTMYAMLERLRRRHGERMNFLTIEDPVERDLGFAGQVQVNRAQGLTFETALRSALRHDPNALMIGEIRDAETARVAIQAGMTGHLVVSTVHAGRAARVFARLLSMGMEPYLVASALGGAVAQRLARVLCPACRRAAPESVGGFEAPGCEECDSTGVRGRTGLFELAEATEALRELILSRAAPGLVSAEAARGQSTDLPAEGRRLVEQGEISRAEFDFVLADEPESV